jgi:hypothetical protein
LRIYFIFWFFIAGIATIAWECVEWLRIGYFHVYTLCSITGNSELVCDVSYHGWKGVEKIFDYLFNQIPLFFIFFGLSAICLLGDSDTKKKLH